MKNRIKSLLERKMKDPTYRSRFERNYPAFTLEVQILKAMERKDWTYGDLAKALATSKSNVSRDLSAGGIRSASLPRLARMAEVLDMEFVPLMIEQKRRKKIYPKICELAAI